MSAADEPNPKTQAAAGTGSPAELRDDEKKDDMYDSEQEMHGDGLLATALRILQQAVSKPYWSANRKALDLQKKHQWITWVGLLTGTTAVVMAILQFAAGELGWEHAKEFFGIVEVIAAILAAIYVIRGLIQAVQKHWLLERHKAERLRLEKYRAILTLPTMAGDTAKLEQWAEEVKRKVRTICAIEELDMKRWIGEKPGQGFERNAGEKRESLTKFETVLEYYREKRLEKQLNYFFLRMERSLGRDSATKFLPPALFLLSIACAITHAFLHGGIAIGQAKFRMGEVEWEHPVSVLLITLAALLPVLGAAIRTHRSANEFGRNTVRFRSVYQKLLQVKESLTFQMEAPAKLALLVQAEQTLEDEHCEWLRLMEEAEWYG